MPVIELRAGPMHATLRPDLGASVAGLWLNAVPVLRSTDAQTLTSARASGCFPLVPYSNRIGQRRFTWQGQNHTLGANAGADNPHAMHGSAWVSEWQTVHADEHSALLRYVQPADASPDTHWPFAFECDQHFTLTDTALQLRLTLRNTDTRPQPAGLGWHPYFPKRSASRMHVECSARWDRDAANLPTQRQPQRSIDAEVKYLDFDHCFEGWPGTARVRDETLAVTITSSLPYLVIYTPPDAPHFCIEPVSHVNNAVQMADPAAHGLRNLAPGETMDAWMTIDAKPR